MDRFALKKKQNRQTHFDESNDGFVQEEREAEDAAMQVQHQYEEDVAEAEAVEGDQKQYAR